MVDLTKIAYYSKFPAFKNNKVYTGTLTISGSTTGGANVRTFNVALDSTPDLVDITFNGPTDTVFGSDPRPSNAWFKNGYVWVRTNSAGGGDPSSWLITSRLNGSLLTITATMLQTFATGETLTSTDFQYKLVDYSAF